MPETPFHGRSERSSWDTLVLGPFVFPGIAQVTVSHQNEIDVIKPRGRQLAHVRPMGTSPRMINVVLTIHDNDEYQELVNNILPNFSIKGNTKTHVPYGFSHPQAEIFGIKEVLISTISPGVPSSETGWEISIDLLEYVRDPNRLRYSKNPWKNEVEKQRYRRGWPQNPSHANEVAANALR